MSEYNLMHEVPERDATGSVAAVYDDIRQHLPIVNLIWRHLATRPAALDWAWSTARPLYASGLAQQGAERLGDALTLPELPLVPAAATRALGLSGEDRSSIEAMLRAYNRGNGLNLIALSAVLVPQEAAGSAASSPAPESSPADADEELPVLPSLDELPEDTRALVLDLNQMGARGSSSPIVASLYRHLGYWPAYLALAWAQLAPLEDSGRLATTIDEVQASAEQQASAIASHRGEAPAAGRDADVEFARRAIAEFRDSAICRMVAIGLLLSRSLDAPRG